MPTTTEASEWSFPNRATQPGSPAYYAVRFAPPSRRDILAMLLAWQRQIRDIALDPIDPGVARLKLDWWRQELVRTAAGEARHPLAIGLQCESVVRDHACGTMQRIVDAAEATLRNPILDGEAAFVADCRANSGRLFELIGRVEGGAADEAGGWQGAGAYCEAVERIRHAKTSPGRLPVPLQQKQLSPLDAATRRRRFDELLDALIDQVPPARSGFVRRMTALQRALHAKMRARYYAIDQVFIDRAPIAHLWTAWRAR